MQNLYGVPAPAKLNLFLHVVGQRPDGYHLLESVFRFIDLSDQLDFELTTDGSISRITAASVPPESDLVIRAAKLLQAESNTSLGAKISYRKQIPMGGGLGGGSSNAATTLIALNRLWQLGYSRSQLLRLALRLGADVPIFVFGQPAFAQGIGEILTAVKVPQRAYLLIKPKVEVATVAIFRQKDLTRDSESVKIHAFTDWQTKNSALFGHNDLQATVFKLHPVIAKTWQFLLDSGINTRLTGSGSCLFAEFDNLSEAKMQQDQIIGKINQQPDLIESTWVCQGITNHPLWGWLKE